jgi:hypothetical protein
MSRRGRWDDETIHEAFRQVAQPPGLDRWRQVRAARQEKVRRWLPERPESRRRLTVFAGAVAVVAVLAAVPLAGRLAHHPARAPVAPAQSGPPQPVEPTGRPGLPASPSPGRTGAGATGVPAGTTLHTHAGDLVVTARGTVVDSLLVTGSVIVRAPDVTIRRTRVAPADHTYWAVQQDSVATNLTVEDSEIDGGGHTGTAIAQGGTGLTVLRCAIHDAASGVGVHSGASIADSLLYGVTTGVVTQGGSTGITVWHDTITTSPDAAEAAIALYDHTGPDSDVTIQGNLLTGGNYTLYAGGDKGSQDIRVTGNRFSRAQHPNGGRYGPVISWDAAGRGNTWTDNAWADTGVAIRP